MTILRRVLMSEQHMIGRQLPQVVEQSNRFRSRMGIDQAVFGSIVKAVLCDGL
jgi:hypothetical protein